MDTEDDGPKKYIRTFEGDMETVQKGGTPDLTPFKEQPEPPAPTPVPVNVPAPPSVASAVPQQEPNVSSEAPMSETPETQNPKERLVAASPIAGPIPEPESPVVPMPEPEPVVRVVTPIETYASDFTKRMQDTNASTATVIAAEQDSAQGAPVVAPEPLSRSNLLFIIGGVILLIAAGVGGYFAYVQYVVVNAPVVVAPIISAPIFFDDKEQILVTGSALTQAIIASVARPIATGAVRLLYNPSTTTPDSIFNALGVPAPDILLRNVNKEGSMAGVVFVSGNQSPFFILSVASYSNTFSGMLSWEGAMPRDLAALFPPYPVPVVATPVVATTTATTTVATTTKKTAKKTVPKATSTPLVPPAPPTPVFVPAFHDEVVSNHDVRVYRDAAGRSILLYGYWNQSTLVIARDPAAFTEILQRLATTRTP